MSKHFFADPVRRQCAPLGRRTWTVVKDFLPFLYVKHLERVMGAMQNSQSADIVDRADREKRTHLLDANVDVVTSITLVISR